MHARRLIAAAILLAPTPIVAQGATPVRLLIVRDCRRADSTLGHMWRSQGQQVFVAYRRNADRTDLEMPARSASWQVGKSQRVVGIGANVSHPGPPVGVDSATLLLTIRLVDTLARKATDYRAAIFVNAADTLDLGEPYVLRGAGTPVKGFAVSLIYTVPWAAFSKIAAADRVEGEAGPHPFHLYDWERHDLNTLYRAVMCGAGL